MNFLVGTDSSQAFWEPPTRKLLVLLPLADSLWGIQLSFEERKEVLKILVFYLLDGHVALSDVFFSRSLSP